MDLISIIVPIHNAGKTICDCVGSICNQSYKNIEILLINNGSSDNSYQVIQSLGERDPRIKIYSVDEAGVSNARNIGLKEATGEYIAFVDADDAIDKTMIEKLHAALIFQAADLAVCKYYSDGEHLIETNTNCRLIDRSYYFQEMMLPKDNIAAFVWNRLYRKEIITNSGLIFNTDIKVCEDTLFNYEYFGKCSKIVMVDETLYRYQINNESVMFATGFNPSKLTANIAYKEMLQESAENKRIQVQIACMAYNLMMYFQIKKYSYRLDKNEEKKIVGMIKLNKKAFMKSSLPLKYKFAYLLFLI